MCFTSILTVHRMALITVEYLYLTMSEIEWGKEETFLAKVRKGWRLGIREPIRESLGLELDDRLRVTVQVDGRKKVPGRAQEETFLAKTVSGRRITVYEPIRESLGLEMGDRVRVTIRKKESPQGR